LSYLRLPVGTAEHVVFTYPFARRFWCDLGALHPPCVLVVDAVCSLCCRPCLRAPYRCSGSYACGTSGNTGTVCCLTGSLPLSLGRSRTGGRRHLMAVASLWNCTTTWTSSSRIFNPSPTSHALCVCLTLPPRVGDVSPSCRICFGAVFNPFVGKSGNKNPGRSLASSQ
jgi:hypothetical protein